MPRRRSTSAAAQQSASGPAEPAGPAERAEPVEVDLSGFGKYAGPATLVLASLADGAKHGYALAKDIEAFADVRLAPGTLYEVLARLESRGFIASLPAEDRRKPYELTAAGVAALQRHLDRQRQIVNVGMRRLRASGAAG